MRYTAFIKSECGDVGIEEILKSSPSVLLGVDQNMEQTLAALRIKTVFDLGLSTLFNNASQLLSNSLDIGSSFQKFGRAPSSMVDKSQLIIEEVTSLPFGDLKALVGVDSTIEPALTSQFSITKIRDLALWPPYLAAKAILVEAYNPTFIDVTNPEAPKELVPISGEFGTERHLYSSIVMFPGVYKASKPLNNVLFDITAAGLQGFEFVRFGARLTFSQTWFPKYVAKGQLLHSLPLAPGESTNVAVIDWTNKSKAATEQQISESEKLYSTNDRTRTISQISNSVANDFESGSSETFAEGASASAGGMAIIGIGVGSVSGSVNESASSTHTVSTGSRSIASSLQQNIVDSTQQNSSSVRSQRAAVVSEVSQSDSRNFSTRNVTNYNHMHSLTLQYYEVIQIYETQVRLEDAERCIFIPMALFNFYDERVIFKYLSILKRAALNYNTLTILRTFGDDPYGYTMKWGKDRIPEAQIPFNFVRVPFLEKLVNSYRDLDNRGFIKVKDGFQTNARALNSELKLNYQLQLNNVVVLSSREQSPQSLIRGVEIDLEDGTTISVPMNPQEKSGDPASINDAFNGKPISFGQIRGIRLQTEDYVPDSKPDAVFDGRRIALKKLPDNIIRILLAVKLNGESHFLDASFLMGGSAADYTNSNLFTIDPLPKLQLLEAELMDHQLYYSQQIWLQENPQNIIMQFAPLKFTIDGKSINLVDYITPIPLKVVGNYLVYRFTYEEDSAWKKWLEDNADPSKVTADMVAIPTGGVFAEAVLGRYNAAEKLDITRFANWDDSPPLVKPPEISSLKFTEPTLPAVPPQATFSQPLVNIQAPISLPAPTGLSDALANIVKGASFPDVSGVTETGAAASNATDLASQDSIAAMKASGDAFAQMISSISKVLQTALSKDATKTLSDVGALVNKKQEETKQDGTDNKSNGNGSNGSSAKDNGTKDKESQLLDDVIKASTLASLATGAESETATDATDGTELTTISSDKALLDSKLITDPLFTDVEGFLVLLQLIPDENILDVMEKRFSNLDKSIDPKAKYTELLNSFTANNSHLTSADRILFALCFQKESVLPNSTTLDQNQIKNVKKQAVEKMVKRAFTIAKRVNNSEDAKEAMRQIFLISNDQSEYKINHIAYMLATAYHESAMGKFMTEDGNGVSTDTIFTKDRYFFEPLGAKKSYNGINGNQLAGDQLKTSKDIKTAADVTLWNGTTYPNDQPDDVKKAARACDFYRFIGRGLVQITGRSNYKRYSNKAAFGNVDFIANPDKIAEIPVAARILVTGMMEGDFRGDHKLSEYDKADGFEGINARDIVNGDKSTNGKRISDIAVEFKNSLIINAKLDESPNYK